MLVTAITRDKIQRKEKSIYLQQSRNELLLEVTWNPEEENGSELISSSQFKARAKKTTKPRLVWNL